MKIFRRWVGRVKVFGREASSYSSRLVRALAETEIQMRREEIIKQINAQHQGR